MFVHLNIKNDNRLTIKVKEFLIHGKTKTLGIEKLTLIYEIISLKSKKHNSDDIMSNREWVLVLCFNQRFSWI